MSNVKLLPNTEVETQMINAYLSQATWTRGLNGNQMNVYRFLRNKAPILLIYIN